jgi:hypothetical protein
MAALHCQGCPSWSVSVIDGVMLTKSGVIA